MWDLPKQRSAECHTNQKVHYRACVSSVLFCCTCSVFLAWPGHCFVSHVFFFVFIFSLVTLRNSGEKCYSLVFVLWFIFFLEFESHEKDERKPDYCSTQVLWRLISNRAIFIWSFSFSPRSPTFFFFRIICLRSRTTTWGSFPRYLHWLGLGCIKAMWQSPRSCFSFSFTLSCVLSIMNCRRSH